MQEEEKIMLYYYYGKFFVDLLLDRSETEAIKELLTDIKGRVNSSPF